MDTIRNTILNQQRDKTVVLTELSDNSGALAVFPIEETGIHNAHIMNADGTLRCKVEIPQEFQNGFGFLDAYYVTGEMTAIFSAPGRDFAFVIDEKSGRVIRSYETR